MGAGPTGHRPLWYSSQRGLSWTFTALSLHQRPKGKKIRVLWSRAQSQWEEGTRWRRRHAGLNDPVDNGGVEARGGDFTDIDGCRGGYVVVNMDDASQIPALAEPLLLGLGSAIQVHPVMSPEDLEKATPAIEQAAKK